MPFQRLFLFEWTFLLESSLNLDVKHLSLCGSYPVCLRVRVSRVSRNWHDPQIQVLRVEILRFSSSKISIYESPFLPEPTTGAVCREGGPETESATAGT